MNKRIKSLLWRSGMMSLAVFLDVVVQGLSGLDVPEYYVVFGGLVFGEISKQINSYYSNK